MIRSENSHGSFSKKVFDPGLWGIKCQRMMLFTFLNNCSNEFSIFCIIVEDNEAHHFSQMAIFRNSLTGMD